MSLTTERWKKVFIKNRSIVFVGPLLIGINVVTRTRSLHSYCTKQMKREKVDQKALNSFFKTFIKTIDIRIKHFKKQFTPDTHKNHKNHISRIKNKLNELGKYFDFIHDDKLQIILLLFIRVCNLNPRIFELFLNSIYLDLSRIIWFADCRPINVNYVTVPS